MSSIRNRQEGFEKKFAMDEESKFKAMARRNKLLGRDASGYWIQMVNTATQSGFWRVPSCL